MSDETLEVAIVENGSNTNKLVQAVEKLAAASDKLASATDKSTAASKRSEDAAAKAAKNNEYLAKSLGNVNSAASGLQAALAGVGAGLTVNKFIEAADAYTQMSNKLRILTTDQTKINGILDQAYTIAQKTGTGFADVANTYGKVADSANKYKISQADVGKITQTIAQSIQLTGTSAQEASTGLRQFSQMLDSGQVQAEELNSIIESTPGLAKTMTAGLQKNGIVITGTLKQMAESGKIGVKDLLNGLLAMGDSIDKLASTSAPTLAASFVRIENAFIKYVGETNKANGVTNKLAGGLDVLAANMDKVVPIAAGLAGVLALGAIAGAVSAIGSLVSALTVGLIPALTGVTVAIAANPLIAGAVLVALAAGAAAWGTYGDKVKAVVPTLQDLGTKSATTKTGIEGMVTSLDLAKVTVERMAPANDNAARSLDTAKVAATAAGAGFTEVARSASALPAGLEPARTAATATGDGFQVMSMNADQSAQVLTKVGTTFGTTAPAIVNVGTAARTTGQALAETTIHYTTAEEYAAKYAEGLKKAESYTREFGKGNENMQGPLQATSAIFADTTPKVKLFTSVLDSATDATNKHADATKAAEQARKDFDIRMQESGKKATEFAANLRRASSAVNAFGESLQTIEDFLAKNKAITDKVNQELDEYFKSTQSATTSTGSLTRTLNDNVSAADRAAASYDRAAVAANGLATAARAAGGAGTYLGQNAAGGARYAEVENFQQGPQSTTGYGVAANVRDSLGVQEGGSFTTGGGPGVAFDGIALGYYPARGSPEAYAEQSAYVERTTGMLNALQRENRLNAVTIADVLSQNGPGFVPDLAGQQALMSRYPVSNDNSGAVRNSSPAFATGGSFMVGGSGGTDSQQVSFRATPNERVSIETPAQVRKRERQGDAEAAPARRMQTVSVKIVTPEFDNFRRNSRQIGQDLAARVRKAS